MCTKSIYIYIYKQNERKQKTIYIYIYIYPQHGPRQTKHAPGQKSLSGELLCPICINLNTRYLRKPSYHKNGCASLQSTLGQENMLREHHTLKI